MGMLNHVLPTTRRYSRMKVSFIQFSILGFFFLFFPLLSCVLLTAAQAVMPAAWALQSDAY